MNIELIEITQDYCIEREGNYLIRTMTPDPGLPNNRFSDKFHYLETRVSRRFDEKNKKWVMSIDVNNQTPTHMSKLPLKEYKIEVNEVKENNLITKDAIELEANKAYPWARSSSDPSVEGNYKDCRKAYIKGASNYIDGAMEERKIFRKFLEDFGSKELFEKWLEHK